MRRLRVGVLIVLGLLMLLVPQLGGDYYVHVFALVFTNVILAASLRPSLTCGQLNIGHSAFMSIGAYASALLAKFIHLEQIPDDPGTWPTVRQAPRLAATLAVHRADALLYRRLATLRTDAPIGTLEETRFGGVPRERFLQFCEALGTNELRGRPTRWAP